MESIESSLLNITPEIVRNIRKIYNLDDPKRLEEAIDILEDWIQKQPHIVKKDFSRRYLEVSIISSKGSVEKAKKQIDRLCTFKTLIPKLFSKYNLKTELHTVLEKSWHVPLPRLTEDYYRIILIKGFSSDYTPEEILQYFQATVIVTEYITVYVNGFTIIVDYRGLNLLQLVTRMSTADVQQFINALIEGYGARLKNIHIITESTAINLLVATAKQFIKEKIIKKLQIVRTLEELHNFIPKDLLPEEYGGKEKSYEKIHADWVEELSSEKHIEYLKMMSKACTDETKRPIDKFNEEYMGMPGSFRNLIVD
ncbi:alpha-tocopherol transfer protein-like [Spodoptera frugiperda]|uniref:Alpha-tocopherol transfer protein-like n=1 Tax=Spodoptera frugiperda TaxID=7108 RepID=A0A9R0DSR7_SPOFR|nr:alpha-tocopherol transfer protein-like [Spodoptera frugiperda]